MQLYADLVVSYDCVSDCAKELEMASIGLCSRSCFVLFCFYDCFTDLTLGGFSEELICCGFPVLVQSKDHRLLRPSEYLQEKTS
jgi:hypothetical protein